jgi:hypothetical protein
MTTMESTPVDALAKREPAWSGAMTTLLAKLTEVENQR